MKLLPHPYRLLVATTENGSEPFTNWIKSLRDRKGRAVILRRLMQVEDGLIGSYRSLGAGLFELKIAFGPGYRVYFGLLNKRTILLLGGSDKHRQEREILRAKRLWKEQ